jgi:tRNA(Ile)-lysidine synthase
VRYGQLALLAHANALACVMLAQHADDQVETVLLALSRGAGVPGMAAMPARFERHGTLFLRPVLGVSGPAIRAWLASAGIGWIQDPTNADESLTRNRIRHQLMPALEQAFPGFRETFARSATHAAQAKRLLAEVAEADLPGQGAQPAIKALQALSPARQANALRHWLKSQHDVSPSTAQLAELQSQIAACTTRGHAIRIKVGGGFVQRAGDCLGYTGAVRPGSSAPL